ncbi:MAG: aminomethyl-transferring glycine dehydrogenase subunit GcvPB [Acidobacteriia bacterium]|nr:aminomethyl-transferring glycine dehydrogenase subunit GcvPB [Terriglobia bacterium]
MDGTSETPAARARRSRDRSGLLFEEGGPGRIGIDLPPLDVPDAADPIEPGLLRERVDGMPELSEPEVVRHFTRLSMLNYAVDRGLYPLGSCTMKYNPKLNEWAARLPGFARVHPYAPEELAQGCLELMHELEGLLATITGMDAVTLQPAAGAHGELTGIMLVRACLGARGDPRKIILVPDSAHGTNPATASFSGYGVEEIPSNAKGCVDLEALRRRVDGTVAALMVTNPNTLGVFEEDLVEIARILHERGAMLYMDGANMNAMIGITRPGDAGVDVMHLNLHKTFSTPHGGGGPGAGAVAVKRHLEPYLPVPRVVKESGAYRLEHDRPHSIGRVRSFHGNFGMFVRAYAYIRALGARGLRETGLTAILNANYVRKGLLGVLTLPYASPSFHEVVFADHDLERETGVRTLDIAKRLMDYGFHPPTVYFPLIVHGAMMIEPTETESREELDAFVAAIKAIVEEARTDPELVKSAPHTTPLRRLDETAAARKPKLRWRP